MAEEKEQKREDYRHFLAMQTRWADNDVYGHVNNVKYYELFDTIVNRFYIDEGGLDIHDGPVIGLVIETGCRYHQPISYPETVEAALRVAHLGRSSVRHEIALFKAGASTPAATAHFVHVFVDRATRRPHEIPARIRAALERIRVG